MENKFRGIQKLIVELDLSTLDDAPISLEQIKSISVEIEYVNIGEGDEWMEEVKAKIIGDDVEFPPHPLQRGPGEVRTESVPVEIISTDEC